MDHESYAPVCSSLALREMGQLFLRKRLSVIAYLDLLGSFEISLHR